MLRGISTITTASVKGVGDVIGTVGVLALKQVGVKPSSLPSVKDGLIKVVAIGVEATQPLVKQLPSPSGLVRTTSIVGSSVGKQLSALVPPAPKSSEEKKKAGPLGRWAPVVKDPRYVSAVAVVGFIFVRTVLLPIAAVMNYTVAFILGSAFFLPRPVTAFALRGAGNSLLLLADLTHKRNPQGWEVYAKPIAKALPVEKAALTLFSRSEVKANPYKVDGWFIAYWSTVITIAFYVFGSWERKKPSDRK